MNKFLTFIKELDGRWFVELPDFEGDKSDLEMVMGADTMLDVLAQGDTEIRLRISTDRLAFDDNQMELVAYKEEFNGMWYLLYDYRHNLTFEVWLCAVTKFVFGEYPKLLYIK